MWIEAEDGNLLNCDHVRHLYIKKYENEPADTYHLMAMTDQWEVTILTGSEAECAELRRKVFDMLLYGVSAVTVKTFKNRKKDESDNEAGKEPGAQEPKAQDAEPCSAEEGASAAPGA